MSKIYGIGDEEELAEDLQKELFELKSNPNIIEIPDNATNGDMIKALFPNGIQINDTPIISYSFGEYRFRFSDEWWNAPYKLPELKGENNE